MFVKLLGRHRARVVCLITLLLLSGCDNTTAQEHLQRAEVSYASGEYRTSVIELKNALQKQPDLADARLLLGLSHARLGDNPSALKEFERAYDLGLEDDRLQLGLLSAKNKLGRYQEVIGELEDTGALSPELAAVLGDAYLAGGDPGKAKPLYQQALDIAPGNLGLGTVAWAQGDLERAGTYLRRAVELEPGNLDAWLRLGEFELSMRAFPEAETAFLRASELPAGQLSGKLGISRTLLAQGRVEDAAVYVEQVLQAVPELFLAHYLDALIKYQQQDIDGAEAALREVQRSVPNHAPSLYLMGAVKFQQGQLSQAEDNLRRYLAVDRNNESAAKLLASVLAQQGELEAVVELLSPFADATVDPQLLAMIGTSQLRLGQMDVATETLQKAVALAPDEAPFRNQLALSLLYAGDEEGAQGELQTAIEVDGDQFQSDYLMAMLRIRDRDFAGAATAIDELIRKSPDSPLGYNLKGAVLLGQADVDAATEQFETALRIDPGYLPAASNLARLDEAAGNLEASRVRYEGILANDPNSVGAHLALAELAAKQREFAAAEEHLQEALAGNPDVLRARLGLIRLYLQQNELTKADNEADAALLRAPQSPDVLLLRAEVDLRSGNVADARAHAEALQALAADRNSPEVLLVALGTLQARVGQYTLARGNLTKALALNDANAVALRELARLDLRDNETALARQRLEQLKALDATAAEVVLLEGDLLQIEGRADEAMAVYRGLVEDNVREGLVRLTMIQLGRGELEAAVAELSGWLESHPDDLGIKLLKADALMRQPDKSDAVAQYEQLVQADNPIVLNNLAWLYMERGDERALGTARRAQELAPNNADVADTLGWILVKEGQAEEALTYIRRSVQLNPNNATVQYHLGVAYLESGDRGSAEAALREAVGLGDFPELEQANELLADI